MIALFIARKVFASVIISLCCFAAAAQKHTAFQSPAPAANNDVQLVSTNVLAKSYPFALQKNGDINQQTSSGSSFSAQIKSHRLHGKWQSHYANGQQLDEGILIKGIPHDEWKVWSQSGKLLAIRNYDADLLRRIKQEIHLNHPRNYFYTITHQYKKKGQQVMKYLSAAYSFQQASFVQPSSVAQLVEQNAANTNNYHPAFTECLHHGLYMSFYENGLVRDSGQYSYGLKEGVWIHRTSQDGAVWKGAYKHGLHIREWKLYNTHGKLVLIVFYNHTGEELWRKKI